MPSKLDLFLGIILCSIIAADSNIFVSCFGMSLVFIQVLALRRAFAKNKKKSLNNKSSQQ